MQSCCAVLPVKLFPLLRFSLRDRRRILRSGPLYRVPSDQRCPYVSISVADNILKLLFIPGNVLSVS